ncbi:MAG: heme exporter protein CcmD [Geminicoccaceae bacterium]|nr:heme exporter protein CcmD [Geminicoccaceae bacterium]
MEFIEMGGYGGYVWSAFGFTLVLTLGLAWQSWRQQRQRGTELMELRRRVRSGDAGRPVRRLVAVRADGQPGPSSGS